MKGRAITSFLVDLRPRQVARWQRTRSRGRLRFVLVDGLLLYGGVLALLGSIAIYLLDRNFHEAVAFSWHPQPVPPLFTRVILPTIGIALVAGLIEGVTMWWLMEFLYRRHVRRNAAHA